MKTHFISRDQELMTAAINYRKYLFGLVKPYIKGDVLEIGAGIGNMTDMVYSQCSGMIDSITCVEAEQECVDVLKEKFCTSKENIEILQGYFPETSPEKKFDLIYHYNVLEHIDDDATALKACYKSLKPQGVMFAYVPAFQVLYGSMDKQLKHYRRYSKKSITEVLNSAGFEVKHIKYCNLIGFFGWFYNNRILKIKEQKSNQIFIFDKLILPIQAWLEKIIGTPLGQNICVIASKPEENLYK